MIGRIACALALASAASAQLASSPSYTLDAVAFGGAGGGSASVANAAFAVQEPVADGAVATSPSFQAQVGFLVLYDLEGDEPGVFAVTPEDGPIAGGTPITVQGLHFDRNGTAGVVSVDVGGQSATSVVVLSDSMLTAVTPPGAYGPANVTVSTAHGVGLAPSDFVYSPGLVTSPVAWQTGTLRIANYGPPGATYLTEYSTAQTSIPLPPFGTLLIGPAPILDGVPLTPYPASGVSEVFVTVPQSPSAAGLTLYLQSAAILSLAPLDVQLVNRSSTLLQ